jgi:hypothetical protein
MERTQKEMAPERKYYEPKACWGTVKLPRAIDSSATKPDASRRRVEDAACCDKADNSVRTGGIDKAFIV